MSKPFLIERRKSESLSSRAYYSLKELILNNQMKAGTYYLERELAENLDISRTPLKEALVKLANEGLITIQPRHGVRIQPISADDLEDIYQIMSALESEAVKTVAATTLSEEQQQLLIAANNQVKQALLANDLETWAEMDKIFHGLILKFCGNERLEQTVDLFWSQAHRASLFTLNLRDEPLNKNDHHDVLLETLFAHQAEQAVVIHQKHRRKAQQLIVGLLRKFRFDGL